MIQDVNIVFKDFPEGGSEMVLPNEDGSFTVILNSRLNYESQFSAYIHALKHINGDDFQKNNVQQIEYEAHCD